MMNPRAIYLLSGLLLLVSAVSAKKLTGISPNSGKQGKTLSVAISGQTGSFSSGTNTVWFSQGSSTVFYAKNVIFYKSDTLFATLPISKAVPTGVYDMNYYNSSSGTLKMLKAFTVTAGITSKIVKVSPSSANQGQKLDVQISGQNTSFNSGTSTLLWFSQGTSTIIYPNSIKIAGADTLIGNFSIPKNAVKGWYDVNTYDDIDGDATLSNGFYIGGLKPKLVSVNPDSSKQGTTLTVNISGQSTSFTQGTVTAPTAILKRGTNIVFGTAVNSGSWTDSTMQFSFSFANNAVLGKYDFITFDDIDSYLYLPQSFRLDTFLSSAIEEFNKEQFGVTISPNPFNDGISISYNLTKSSFISLHLFNTIGKEVYSTKDENQNAGSHNFLIPSLGYLPSGLYIMRVYINEELTHYKLIKY